MKHLHRPDLLGWAVFDEARDMDFNGTLWVREGGNVIVDPVRLRPHDLEHLRAVGGAAWVVVTNSDHVRDAVHVAELAGARLAGPAGERDGFPVEVDRWLADGEALVPGLVAFALEGSKTPGELALLLDGTTLITGDLVRGPVGGRLAMLPDAKLRDPAAARASVRRLAALPDLEAVLVGDGWHVFRDGGARLRELAASLPS